MVPAPSTGMAQINTAAGRVFVATYRRDASGGQRPTNRLAGETSAICCTIRTSRWTGIPGEAWAGRGADRPVLLSIGYAACHWCHVMAQSRSPIGHHSPDER
jgi:hypothetical protein